MARMMIAYSQAVAGRDAEYEAWLPGHVTEVLAVEGFERAQVYRATVAGAPARFAVWYELSATSGAAAESALYEAVRAGRVGSTDALDRSATELVHLEPIGDSLAAGGPR